MPESGFCDVLEALEPFRSHALYPAARAEVLSTRRAAGIGPALRKANEIAEAMSDATLSRRLR